MGFVVFLIWAGWGDEGEREDESERIIGIEECVCVCVKDRKSKERRGGVREEREKYKPKREIKKEKKKKRKITYTLRINKNIVTHRLKAFEIGKDVSATGKTGGVRRKESAGGEGRERKRSDEGGREGRGGKGTWRVSLPLPSSFVLPSRANCLKE